LLIVLDGLTPKYLAEEERVLEKSYKIWDPLFLQESSTLSKELKERILK